MAHAKLKPTPTTVRVGSLGEDLASLAGKVVRTLADGPRFIWVEDDLQVYSGNPEALRQLPESWIVGTFAMGHPVVDIAEDLRMVTSERSRNWILD